MGATGLCWSFLFLGALAACRATPQTAPRAQEDPRALIAAVSVAPVYVCGTVGRVARIDRTGYRAELVVQQVFFGFVKPEERLEIAWEELATQRAPRFAKGDRLLVALSPLPATTLWLHRFPPQLRNDKTFAVAAQGDAFLREPDCDGLDALKGYVRLEPKARAESEGAHALAQLAASSEERLAVAALETLAASFEERVLHEGEVTRAMARALREGGARMKRAVLEIARTHKLEELRDAIREIAQSDLGDLGYRAWEALLSLKDPLVAEHLPQWISATEPRSRVLGAKAAATLEAFESIEQASRDPAPEVRQALAEHLQAETQFLPWLLALLADPDQGVQRAAAAKVGSIGPAALPALEALLSSDNPQQQMAAILALAEIGEHARGILERIAAEHPDENLRRLAAVALARPLREQ